MNDDEIKEIKTILVGMTGTGKTNIINALTGKKFEENKFSTTTSSFIDKTITLKNKKYNLEIWDTAGQEKYRSLTKIFINDSKIVIFVYDITTRSSFDEIDFWVRSVKEILGNNPVFGLAGNKKDLFQNEEVSEEEGEQKAQEIGALFKLTSAKTGQVGINEFMQSLLEEYIKKIGGNTEENIIEKEKTIDSSFNLMDVKKKKKKNNCC